MRDQSGDRFPANVREVRVRTPSRHVGARNGTIRSVLRRHVITRDAERDDELLGPLFGRFDGAIRRLGRLCRRVRVRVSCALRPISVGRHVVTLSILSLPSSHAGVRPNDASRTTPKEVPAPLRSGGRCRGVFDRNPREGSLAPKRPSVARRIGTRFPFVAHGVNARNRFR
jgi:hypothetical protein